VGAVLGDGERTAKIGRGGPPYQLTLIAQDGTNEQSRVEVKKSIVQLGQRDMHNGRLSIRLLCKVRPCYLPSAAYGIGWNRVLVRLDREIIIGSFLCLHNKLLVPAARQWS
jgi:hypothetical protein